MTMGSGQRSNRVLVAGASGVVGYAAAARFAREPGWEVVGLARRPRPIDGVQTLTVDLADRSQTADAIGSLDGITHVVYAALFEKPGLIPGWFEDDQMQRNLDMLANLLDPLVAMSPGLRHVSLLQGAKAYGAHVAPMKVPGREREPRHPQLGAGGFAPRSLSRPELSQMPPGRSSP